MVTQDTARMIVSRSAKSEQSSTSTAAGPMEDLGLSSPPGPPWQKNDVRKLSEGPRRSSSVESFDLGGDLDLEVRLEGGRRVREVATFDAEKLDSERTAGVMPAPAEHAGPATLHHDDPENPRNWSTRRKWIITVVLSLWVLSLTYASTAYVASLSALETRYNMSPELTIAGVTLTVVGFAAGPLLFGPSSELFGRRAIYVVTGLLYSAFSFGAAFAPNAAGLLVFRFFMGFFGASSINNIPASIGDYTTPLTRNTFTILYALMAFGGPALGPLCSAFIQTDAGFQWNLRVMAIFCTVTSILVAFVPETHGPTLLKWRVKKEGNAPPPVGARKILAVYRVALARPIIYLFSEPLVTLISLYMSVLYGILYGFFEAFTVVYIDIRGFSATSYGLTYISLGLGFLIACFMLATVSPRLYAYHSKIAEANGTKTQPEARLGIAFFGAITAPISLFLFAWTAPFTDVHWIAPCIAETLFAMSMTCIFNAFILYLIDIYLATAASALAAGMASRALVGSAFPLFALQMYHKLTVQGATSLLAGLAVCLMPLPFIFLKFGPAMRRRSKHAGS